MSFNNIQEQIQENDSIILPTSTSSSRTVPTNYSSSQTNTSSWREDWIWPCILLDAFLMNNFIWWDRSFWFDWFVAIFLIVSSSLVEITVDPTHTTIFWCDQNVNWPHNGSWISNSSLAVVCFLVSFCLFIFISFSKIGFGGHEFHNSALGISQSFAFSQAISVFLSVIVGRVRPDGVSRCDLSNSDSNELSEICSNGSPIYYNPNDFPNHLDCDGSSEEVNQIWRSFPASSVVITSSTFVFLSFYLAGKLKLFDRQGYFSKLFIILVPIVFILGDASSRIGLNINFPSDCLAALIIGTSMSLIGFFHTFHWPWDQFKAGHPISRSHLRQTWDTIHLKHNKHNRR